MGETNAVGWRRDASSSRSLRALWALGSGGLLAGIGLVVVARLVALTAGLGDAGPLVVVGAIAVGAVGLVALLAGRGARWRRRLPGGDTIDRAVDTVAGAAVMAAVIVTLAVGVGGGVGTGLAVGTVPLAFAALAFSSFLESVGTLDREAARLHLHEPEATVDLGVVDRVAVRHVGDVAVVRLRYGRPGGEYVPGPRWLALPPAVALELRALVRDQD